MFNSPLLAANPNILSLEISTVLSNVDLFVLFDSPSFPFIGLVSITDTAVITTLSTGAVPAGSLIKLTSAGYALGVGGKGGNGVDFDLLNGGNGADGESSFLMLCNVDLDLDSGRIWAGAGGGGGGGTPDFINGGGGGGGGVSGGLGGGGGNADFEAGGTPGTPGNAATSGINASPGGPGGNGGAGGDWGGSGFAGSGSGAKAGGNAGLAISKGGFALTFVGLKDEATLRTENRIKGVIA